MCHGIYLSVFIRKGLFTVLLTWLYTWSNSNFIYFTTITRQVKFKLYLFYNDYEISKIQTLFILQWLRDKYIPHILIMLVDSNEYRLLLRHNLVKTLSRWYKVESIVFTIYMLWALQRMCNHAKLIVLAILHGKTLLLGIKQ